MGLRQRLSSALKSAQVETVIGRGANPSDHGDEQHPHDERGQHRDLQHRTPVEPQQQKPHRQGGNRFGPDGPAHGMDAERPRLAVRHLLGQHPGGDGMPGGVAHDRNGEQNDEPPVPGRQRGNEVADRDPPERHQEQQSAAAGVVRGKTRGQIGEATADAHQRDQQPDLDRGEIHADGNGRGEHQDAPGGPVVGEMTKRERREKQSFLASAPYQGDRIRVRHVSSNRLEPIGERMVDRIRPRHKHDRGRSWAEITPIGMVGYGRNAGRCGWRRYLRPEFRGHGRGRPVGSRRNLYRRATGITAGFGMPFGS